MRDWFRRTKFGKGTNDSPSPSVAGNQTVAGSATVPDSPQVPGDVYENAASTVIQERHMQHWLDEAVRDCARNGGLEQLNGTGKPVDVPTGDGLNSILKNANVLPPWLELQHEIRDSIRALLRKHDPDRLPSFSTELDALNQKIVKYNMSVPTPILQKMRLRPDSIAQQLAQWE
ncbi:DUF1992 domain-containing protein [Paenibacillus hodogayensis]|uniref:DUF1992 domain-containing protein n=1 Tax=Paenibacillus hodogayensis TaxID=279208 RepID=A0ABV5VZ28_9BACL